MALVRLPLGQRLLRKEMCGEGPFQLLAICVLSFCSRWSDIHVQVRFYNAAAPLCLIRNLSRRDYHQHERLTGPQFHPLRKMFRSCFHRTDLVQQGLRLANQWTGLADRERPQAAFFSGLERWADLACRTSNGAIGGLGIALIRGGVYIDVKRAVWQIRKRRILKPDATDPNVTWVCKHSVKASPIVKEVHTILQPTGMPVQLKHNRTVQLTAGERTEVLHVRGWFRQMPIRMGHHYCYGASKLFKRTPHAIWHSARGLWVLSRLLGTCVPGWTQHLAPIRPAHLTQVCRQPSQWCPWHRGLADLVRGGARNCCHVYRSHFVAWLLLKTLDNAG